MKTEIWYSVVNCGDGSAYPTFYESRELAEIHQKYFCGDGWGEECTGTITIESNGDIKSKDIQTVSGLLKEAEDDYDPEWSSEEDKKGIEALKKLSESSK